MRAAGARVLAVDSQNFFLSGKRPLHHGLKEWIAFAMPDVDIVLVEGWRQYIAPTLLVLPDLPDTNWAEPKRVIAVVSSVAPAFLKYRPLPHFTPDQTEEITEFLLRKLSLAN